VNESLDVSFVAGPKSDDTSERRQKSREQRNRGLVDPTICDTDRIAGYAFEHPHAGDRVGDVCRERAFDQLHRWEQSIGFVHGALRGDFGGCTRETVMPVAT
jgi:hypothetical protein